MDSGIPVVLFTTPDMVADDMPAAVVAAARHHIRQLGLLGASLVLCSMKTRGEIEAFQQLLEIRAPFVSEGGSAAFVPGDYFPFELATGRDVGGYQALEFGRGHDRIIRQLRLTSARLGIKIIGFSDLSIEEVADDCGMTLLQARLSKLREYGERFRLLDPRESTRERLFNGLEKAGVRCVAAEPYHYASGAVRTSTAVEAIYELYRRHFGAAISTGSEDAIAHFVPEPGAAVADRPRRVDVWASTMLDIVARLRNRVAGDTGQEVTRSS